MSNYKVQVVKAVTGREESFLSFKLKCLLVCNEPQRADLLLVSPVLYFSFKEGQKKR